MEARNAMANSPITNARRDQAIADLFGMVRQLCERQAEVTAAINRQAVAIARLQEQIGVLALAQCVEAAQPREVTCPTS
jgi:hypothetical protein